MHVMARTSTLGRLGRLLPGPREIVRLLATAWVCTLLLVAPVLGAAQCCCLQALLKTHPAISHEVAASPPACPHCRPVAHECQPRGLMPGQRAHAGTRGLGDGSACSLDHAAAKDCCHGPAGSTGMDCLRCLVQGQQQPTTVSGAAEVHGQTLVDLPALWLANAIPVTVAGSMQHSLFPGDDPPLAPPRDVQAWFCRWVI